MKRIILPIVILFGFVSMWAAGGSREKKAKYPEGKCYMYRVTLADKRGTPHSVEHPETFLSRRAIERRARQGISVDTTDLPVSPLYVSDIEAAGAKVVSAGKWNNTVLVRGNDEQRLESLSALPFVKAVRKVWTSPDSIAPPAKREQLGRIINKWDTVNGSRYGHALGQIEMLNGTRLHEEGFNGEGMMIAVLDGGFMNADIIPAFAITGIAAVRDFVVPPTTDIFAEMSHGTKVLSVMAANLPGAYVGAAPGATYLLLRCEDNDTESLAEEDYWAAAVEYADSMGVDVINSSLGFHHFNEEKDNYAYSDQDGHTAMISHTASMLADKGIVLVCSAGNDGMETWKKINFPADAHDILAVGAAGQDGINASFSAVGPTADGRVKPDVMAMGNPTAVISARGSLSKDIGTSFAAPLISALMACLWQALPDKTAKEIIDIVRRSGDNSGTPDNIRGYGVPDFWKAYTLGKQRKETEQ